MVEPADLDVLARRAKSGDERAMARLLDFYRPQILWHAKNAFAPGLERADMEAIAEHGLMKGILAYDESRGNLGTIVRLAIRRNLFSATRLANGEKHRLLNESVRITGYSDDEHDLPIIDDVADSRPTAEDRVIKHDEYTNLVGRLKASLTEMELRILDIATSGGGASFDEIARAAGVTKKAVDNTLGRIRLKFRRLTDTQAQKEASTLTVEAR